MGSCFSRSNSILKSIFISQIDGYEQTVVLNQKPYYITHDTNGLKIKAHGTNHLIYSINNPEIRCISNMSHSRVAISLPGGDIKIFNLKYQVSEMTLHTYEDNIKSLLLNYDKLVISYSNRINVLNLITGRCELTAKYPISCVDSYKDVVGVGLMNGDIKVWNNCVLIHWLSGHKDQITCLLMIVVENQLYLISGSKDKTIRIWNMNSGRCETILYGHSSTINSIVLRNNCLISGGNDGCIKTWDLDKKICCDTIQRDYPIIKLETTLNELIVLYDHKRIEILK